MTEIELRGLDGRNPLAYFAALGCLAALARTQPNSGARLAWTPGPLPRPVLHASGLDPDAVVAALGEDRQAWAESPVLTFDQLEDVKLSAEDQRRYLIACREADDGGRSAGLVTSLIAEHTFAKTGDGKPTDLHFCAGNQHFLAIARKLQDEVTADDLREALFGPWRYERLLPTFGWDMTDDRVYAYGISDPAKTKKYTVPGADWLGFMGLAAYSVIGRGEQGLPPGGSGSWKHGRLQWGLWCIPIGWAAARSLVATGFPIADAARLGPGVFRIFSAQIRRSDQGGYGSFSPSVAAWEARRGLTGD